MATVPGETAGGGSGIVKWLFILFQPELIFIIEDRRSKIENLKSKNYYRNQSTANCYLELSH